MTHNTFRKIIHIDMDAFYASIEQNDNKNFRNKPILVGWKNKRGVVCAASYEARVFGVKSAMPIFRAKEICPTSIIVAPRFERYKEVSKEIFSIFREFTDVIETISLDEAYLDVTSLEPDKVHATKIAQDIRNKIKNLTGLNSSAGVAPNKFLAKIASDWKKPNGIFVIKPSFMYAFLSQLPVSKVNGVGKKTERRLKDLNIHTLRDIRRFPSLDLILKFGKQGARLIELSKGNDPSPVVPRKIRKSLSKEHTFETNVDKDCILNKIPELANQLKIMIKTAQLEPKTVFLKIKSSEFKIYNRQMKIASNVHSIEQFRQLALAIFNSTEICSSGTYRTLGVGYRDFKNNSASSSQPSLFFSKDGHNEYR